MPLQSTLLSGNRRLEDIAFEGKASLRPAPPDDDPDAVKRIQLAIVQLTGRPMPGSFDSKGNPDGKYGQETYQRIIEIQQIAFPNDPGEWDGRVGKKTIEKLDAFLLQAPAPGGPVAPENPVEPPKKLPLDIFVRYRGSMGPTAEDIEVQEAFSGLFNTPAYLATHQKAVTLCSKGFKDWETVMANTIQKVIGFRENNPRGKVIIIGTSAGAMPALKTAVQFTSRGIVLNYVGIGDGAFFGNEATTNPVRIKSVGQISVRNNRMESYFQTFGHSIMIDRKQPNGFDVNTEFHGPIDGFQPIDLTQAPTVERVKNLWKSVPEASDPAVVPLIIRKKFASEAHKAAGDEAERRMHNVVVSVMGA